MDKESLAVYLTAAILIIGAMAVSYWVAESRKPSMEPIVRMNNMVVFSDYGFTVTMVSQGPVIDGNKERVRSKNFVVVYLNITNEGKTAISLFSMDFNNDFKIIDGQNREFDCLIDKYFTEDDINMDRELTPPFLETTKITLQPGGIHEQPLVFEVPPVQYTNDIESNRLRLRICRGGFNARKCKSILLYK